MRKLFEPYQLKDLKLKNRIALSPMCQYKAENQRGIPEEWHFVHLVARAIGGTGLIMTEMTNVEPRGRITENCLGIYSEEQQEAFTKINTEIHKYGAKSAIQIAHAGRKSKLKDCKIIAPSAIPFSSDYEVPKELSKSEIYNIIQKFAEGTKRSVNAGFDTIELHGAHGYLLHQFISKASNQRTDCYGNPTKFAEEVIAAMKSEMPTGMPLIMRISAIEYTENPYTLDEMIAYCEIFKSAGVDMFDVSTGGNSPNKPDVYPAYQTKFAKEIKTKLNVPVISVGALENPDLAEHVLKENEADIIAIGKGMLKDPHWAKTAAQTLGVDIKMPGVYDLGY
ncbi:NADH:flavin oxidoreductase/NADH oxidase [Planococcus sp. S3-L1]|uniref:NADH:flavin oxidoreductase/NADH oxidase n=1 Tax=Planococcus sp. S3-L1 TaxID=3046200 RepID=UPI0024BAA418|nr:NADH:flavin oxidoreductase/NADH oxidase [Planococcus sp. S3-L1]MDJ0332980.1 NADH:flavin oxidoreductase/NADH oxidase [Planococcus sp. S3-L1]